MEGNPPEKCIYSLCAFLFEFTTNINKQQQHQHAAKIKVRRNFSSFPPFFSCEEKKEAGK